MALVTDNIDSYVVLNYYNMTWVGSPATGCSPKTGREWDQDTCTAAQVNKPPPSLTSQGITL